MHATKVTDNRCTHQSHSGNIQVHENFAKKSFRYLIAILPFALILLISTSYQQNDSELKNHTGSYFSPETRNSFSAYFQRRELVIAGDTLNHHALLCIQGLYAENDYSPLWTDMHAAVNELLSVIEHAREFGLEPENYNLIRLQQKFHEQQKSEKSKASDFDFEFEVMLTDAALRFMINLHAGYVALDSSLFTEEWVGKVTAILKKGIYSGNLQAYMLSVEPDFAEYRKLRIANGQFVRSGILTDQVPEIKYPTRDTVLLMRTIREALISLGYMDESSDPLQLTRALKSFQLYHGLMADGKPGVNTIEALRKSRLFRYRVLALNLDRMRKTQYPDSGLIYINIPAYSLKVFEGKKVTGTFRVIVGNPSSPTPVMSGIMQTIVANPFWYVPKSIALNEILPKMIQDSSYLAKNGFSILDENYRPVNASKLDLKQLSASNFNYTFRQNRGLDNSLGQVKFLFTNPHAVYIHDTPGKTLFNKDIRAFSHGCIRVENPEKLAQYLLTSVNRDTVNFKRIIDSGRQYEFPVSRPVQVHITYITCEADEGGSVYFYSDIYGKDKKDLEELGSYMGN